MEHVSKKVGRVPLVNTDYVVGEDSRLQEVLSLLEFGFGGVLMVGIYGVTGIGKTALAQEIYSMITDQFENSYFFPDVRESSSIHGLVHLQNIILSKMIGEEDSNLRTVDRGASMIKSRLHEKKVLLVP